MESFLTYFWGPIFNTVLGAIVAYLIARIHMKNKADNALKDGMISLLRNSIVDTHRRFVMNHEVMTMDVVNAINQCYDSYHELGGNGLATKLIEEINNTYAEGGNQ